VPDPKYGEEVSAAVVLRGAATAEQIQARCRTRLADFKVPKQTTWSRRYPRTRWAKSSAAT